MLFGIMHYLQIFLWSLLHMASILPCFMSKILASKLLFDFFVNQTTFLGLYFLLVGCLEQRLDNKIRIATKLLMNIWWKLLFVLLMMLLLAYSTWVTSFYFSFILVWLVVKGVCVGTVLPRTSCQPPIIWQLSNISQHCKWESNEAEFCKWTSVPSPLKIMQFLTDTLTQSHCY